MIEWIIKQFLKWLICWAKLIDGIVGIITLGFINPKLSFYMAVKYSKYCSIIEQREIYD